MAMAAEPGPIPRAVKRGGLKRHQSVNIVGPNFDDILGYDCVWARLVHARTLGDQGSPLATKPKRSNRIDVLATPRVGGPNPQGRAPVVSLYYRQNGMHDGKLNMLAVDTAGDDPFAEELPQQARREFLPAWMRWSAADAQWEWWVDNELKFVNADEGDGSIEPPAKGWEYAPALRVKIGRDPRPTPVIEVGTKEQIRALLEQRKRNLARGYRSLNGGTVTDAERDELLAAQREALESWLYPPANVGLEGKLASLEPPTQEGMARRRWNAAELEVPDAELVSLSNALHQFGALIEAKLPVLDGGLVLALAPERCPECSELLGDASAESGCASCSTLAGRTANPPSVGWDNRAKLLRKVASWSIAAQAFFGRQQEERLANELEGFGRVSNDERERFGDLAAEMAQKQLRQLQAKAEKELAVAKAKEEEQARKRLEAERDSNAKAFAWAGKLGRVTDAEKALFDQLHTARVKHERDAKSKRKRQSKRKGKHAPAAAEPPGLSQAAREEIDCQKAANELLKAFRLAFNEFVAVARLPGTKDEKYMPSHNEAMVLLDHAIEGINALELAVAQAAASACMHTAEVTTLMEESEANTAAASEPFIGRDADLAVARANRNIAAAARGHDRDVLHGSLHHLESPLSRKVASFELKQLKEDLEQCRSTILTFDHFRSQLTAHRDHASHAASGAVADEHGSTVEAMVQKQLALQFDRLTSKLDQQNKQLEGSVNNAMSSVEVQVKQTREVVSRIEKQVDRIDGRISMLQGLMEEQKQDLKTMQGVLLRGIFEATEVQVPTSCIVLQRKLPMGGVGHDTADSNPDYSSSGGEDSVSGSWWHKAWDMVSGKAVADRWHAWQESLQDELYLYLIDEVTGLPVVPDDQSYPIPIRKQNDKLRTVLPYMKMGLRAMRLLKGVAHVAKYICPGVGTAARCGSAAYDALNKATKRMGQDSTVQEFDHMHQVISGITAVNTVAEKKSRRRSSKTKGKGKASAKADGQGGAELGAADEPQENSRRKRGKRKSKPKPKRGSDSNAVPDAAVVHGPGVADAQVAGAVIDGEADNPKTEQQMNSMRGAALKDFQAFLAQHDTKKSYGGLIRVCWQDGDKAGTACWTLKENATPEKLSACAMEVAKVKAEDAVEERNEKIKDLEAKLDQERNEAASSSSKSKQDGRKSTVCVIL